MSWPFRVRIMNNDLQAGRVSEIPTGLRFPRALTFPAFEGKTRSALFIFEGVMDS